MNPSTLSTVVAGMLFLGLLSVGVSVSVDSPYFSRQPARNTTVREGDTASLQCIVKTVTDSVQWTRDDFGLGMTLDGTSQLRGNKGGTLKIRGNKAKGENNLEITNTQLSDDGKYECQLTERFVRSRPAYLNVLVPPKKIMLKPALHGVITVQHSASVTTVQITCEAVDAKPEAEISWKVEGNELFNIISNRPTTGSEEKLFTSSSSIILPTETLQNGSAVECIVNQAALREPISKAAVLNILHPPSQPVISGITADPLQVGEDFEVTCMSDGGNPPAKITWVIGDEKYEGVYKTYGRRAESVLRYSPKQQDNGKYLKCVVDSTALPTSLEARQPLEVYYPPENIMVDCDPIDGVAVNEDLTFFCYNTDSNPSTTLEWLINGVALPNKTSDDVGAISFHTYSSASGKRKIALTLRQIRRENSRLDIKCRARIPEIAFNREVTVHPKVNYPPRKVSLTIENPLNSPVIDIHPRNDSISSTVPGKEMAFVAGDTIRLSCEAKGGYPAPDLAWFVKNEGIMKTLDTEQADVEPAKSADQSISDEFITKSSIELQLQSTHNRATIICQASSARYKNAIASNVTLSVAFSPDSLWIEQFPKTAVAGSAVSLTCKTTASFPAATISWYKDNEVVNVESVSQLPLRNVENGGYISSSRLRLFLGDAADGTVYTCQATVDPLRETMTQQYTLRVEYAPRLRLDQQYVFNATEGKQLLRIQIKIDSNPTALVVHWFRYERSADGFLARKATLILQNRRFRWDGNGRTLGITDLKRTDDGIYAIQVANARGSVERNITLNVFYPPEIVQISGPSATLNEGDAATLRCDFRSHRLTRPRVSWLKEVPGIGRSDYNMTTYADRSLLSLTNLTAEDRGGYKCTVDNGVGDGDAKSVAITLSYAPVFEDSTPEKVAVPFIVKDSVNTRVPLECLVHSQPPPTIQWLIDNITINLTANERFTITDLAVDAETVKSTLWVKRLIKTSVFSGGLLHKFTCKASNSRGIRTKTIEVVSQGPPDTPSAIFASNKTDTTVTLAWREGFNGGSNQSFLLHYTMYSKHLFQAKFNELRSKTPEITVSGLKPDREYVFRVLAENTRGRSPPSSVIRIRTALLKETESTQQVKRVQTTRIFLFVAAAIVAFTLIIVTSVVIYRRCHAAKKSYRPKTLETDCESLNAESSLSSRCSTAKSPEGRKEDTEIIELQSMNDCTRHLLDNGDGAASIVSDAPYENIQQSCFERSNSRCSNEIAIFRQGGCNVLGGCTFSSFKSLPEANNSPSKSLLDYRNQRATYLTSIRPSADNFSRDSHEAKFRFDVKPTEDCLRTYSDDIKDGYSDVQLPPRLQPYETVRAYAPVCSPVDQNDHLTREDNQLRALLSQNNKADYQDLCSSGNYHTLGPNNPTCGFYSGASSNTSCNAAPSQDRCYYTLASPACRDSSSQYPFTARSHSMFASSRNAADLCTGNSIDTGSIFSNTTTTANPADFPSPPLELIKECHSQEMTTNDDSQNKFKSSYRRYRDGAVKGSQTQSVRFQDNLTQTLSNTRHVPVPTPSPRNLERDSSDDDTDSGCGGSEDVQMRRVVPAKPNDLSRFTSSSHSSGGKSTELRELRV